MNRIKNWIKSLRKQVKFAMYDPHNFDEIFGFTTSRINIISLVTLLVLVVSVLLVFLFGLTPLGNSVMSDDARMDKSVLVDQQVRIDSLKQKVNAQDAYVENLKHILLGTVDKEATTEDTKNIELNLNAINDKASKAEQKVADNVKADQYTNTNKETNKAGVHFMSPLKGRISQNFNAKNHQAVDVVAVADSYFAACLAGTIVYTDFSKTDGYVVIVEHANDFLSIYKHAKAILKKRGDRLQAGDLIGIVGNTGMHSTGPHLHFELWQNQKAVDPLKYIHFEL